MNNKRALNFGLTEIEFTDLSSRLADGDERLFEVIFLRHFQDCLQFLTREDDAPADLAYDATMEAMYAFRNKVEEGKITYGNLRFLLTRMARQYYLKALRKETSDNPNSIPELPEDDPVTFTDEAFSTLRRAWATMGDKCKALLHAYYYQDKSLKVIARETAQNYPTLRKRKQRCMEKLRELVAG